MILEYRQGWELPFDNKAGIGLEEVNVSLGDREKTTPLMIAVGKQHEAVVSLLTSSTALQHNPNVAGPSWVVARVQQRIEAGNLQLLDCGECVWSKLVG